MEMEGMPDGEITGSRVKIGAASNRGRNVMWIVGAVIAAVAMGAFYKLSASNDEPKLRALDDFRAAYAQKCNNAEFAGDAPAYLKDQYLKSDALQQAVQKQAQALQAGTSCADIEQALRTASFPLGAKNKS
jgi:hypothetical protein